MTTVTFKGNAVKTVGSLPESGETIPKFNLTDRELNDVSFDSFQGERFLLNIFPSLDTSVCAKALHEFYKRCEDKEGLVLLNISMDLPFAAARFCENGNIKNAVTLSAFRSSFPEDFGLKVTEGPLRGLLARSVLVVDKNGKVLYSELVPEITQEPNYDAALERC